MSTLENFPRSWQGRADHVPMISAAGRAARRLQDLRDDDNRFMLRLDRASHAAIRALAERFEIAQTELLCQLIAQARPEAFPEGRHRAVAECGFPTVIGKFLALRNYALRYKRL